MICIDGAGTEYFKHCSLPNIKRICREGICSWESLAIVPTVTNVNNVSIVTGCYPEEHGIFTNCYYNVETGEEVYMEDEKMIKSETIFEKISRLGLKSAVITAKDKLRTLIGCGVDISFSAEQPSRMAVEEAGEPPNIYSSEVNAWIFKSAEATLQHFSPTFIYIATTDYIMHKYPPESPEAIAHMQLIDDGIGDLLDSFPESIIGVTADHGMSRKKIAVDLEKILSYKGVEAKVIPTVKDRYLPHHSNLSGSAYIYLRHAEDFKTVYDILLDVEGVEEILTVAEASRRFHLPKEKVGDFLVLGEESHVFGTLDSGAVEDVNLRSHGSLHEQVIPAVMYGLEDLSVELCENRLFANTVLDWLREKINRL